MQSSISTLAVPKRRQLLGCLAAVAASAMLCPLDASATGVEVMTVEQARNAAVDRSLILVDIRTPDEWKDSGIPDVAVALDMTERSFVKQLMALRQSNPQSKIGLICATGGRSNYVATWLVQNKVAGIVDVPAGMHTAAGWLARQLPVRQHDGATGEIPALK